MEVAAFSVGPRSSSPSARLQARAGLRPLPARARKGRRRNASEEVRSCVANSGEEAEKAGTRDEESLEDLEDDYEDEGEGDEDDSEHEEDEEEEEGQQSRGRTKGKNGARSARRVASGGSRRRRGKQPTREDDPEMNIEDDDDLFGGAFTSEPEDFNDSDWLQEEDTDDIRSESSIAESEMEDYFMRDEEDGDDAPAASSQGARRTKGRRKRARAEPFSGAKSQRKRRRKRTAATPSEMPAALKKLMGEATDLYLNGEFDRAVQVLEDIVRQAPGLHDPFHLLGLIYEEAYGDKRRAVDFYLLAAHLVVPGDPELWRYIGSMSLQLNNLPQAIYCFRRCLRSANNARLSAACSAGFHPGVHLLPRLGAGDTDQGGSEEDDDKDDAGPRKKERKRRRKGGKHASMEEEVAFSLASCYQQTGDHSRAVSLLYALLSLRPRDFLLSREIARSLHHLRRAVEARDILEAAVLPLLPAQLRDQIAHQAAEPPPVAAASSASFATPVEQVGSTAADAKTREPQHAREERSQGDAQPATSGGGAGDGLQRAEGVADTDELLPLHWEGRMTLDPLQLDCVNLLAEVYRHLHDHRRCFLLLRFVTRGWLASQLPVDLLVKRAAAELFVGAKTHSADVAESLLRTAAARGSSHVGASPSGALAAASLSSPSSPSDSASGDPEKDAAGDARSAACAEKTPQDGAISAEYVDLFLTLADAWEHAGELRRSLELYKAVQKLPEVATDTSVALQTANCLVKLGELKGAAEFLQGWLARSEARRQQTAGVRDAEVRLLLCDVLKQLGQDLEADYTLLTISYKHLREKDRLPRAWSNADRERDLFDLRSQLEALLSRPSTPGCLVSLSFPTPGGLPHAPSSVSSAANPLSSLAAASASASLSPSSVSSSWASVAHASSLDPPSSSAALPGTVASAASDDANAHAVSSRFLALVQECELDACRVLRQACRKRVEMAQDPDAERFFSPSLPLGLAQESYRALASPKAADAGGSAGSALSADEERLEGEGAKDEAGNAQGFFSLLNMNKRGGLGGGGAASNGSRVKDPHKALQHYKIKQHLGLRSIEDFIGLRGYFDFLCSGMELLRRQGRYEEAVSLLESVLGNWRQKRPDGNDAQKRQIKEALEILSISLSVEGRLSRTALASLRHLLQRRAGSKRYRKTWKALLEVYGRLLFTGSLAQQAYNALAAAKEKDLLLENRSWAIRQLLQRPHNDALTLVVGHFCMLSSRWRFAVAEYTRAHCLRPWDALPCLCLAVAYLCLSTSNKIQNKHDSVLRGFAILGRYCQLRRGSSTEVEACSEASTTSSEARRVFTAETVFNLARAYHHVNLLHLAVPLYIKCLHLLDTQPEEGERGTPSRMFSMFSGKSPSRTPQSENESPSGGASGSRSGDVPPPDADATNECQDAWRLDKSQIQKCAALNLIAIWRNQRGLAQARAVASRYLVWDE
ncbi:general transcription factor IIIC polypeptide 3 GTF3C3 [Besnoitia besnoiti]|uniref:General transcription factor IIIC polypeptide 3 GTF3C3 n=1 Tax=Besnoitia besnoiti TaxID=94643 RepID=A0A2A9M8Q7_BESBE|nr:general transcription factor IIIC polypeptide 3 GTF3C3 [Besnoitia besnoiti]PFH34355.1 general transcription factor IIIC polypeptide 3 GTF3C3 [Besnoitia besnoiti]